VKKRGELFCQWCDDLAVRALIVLSVWCEHGSSVCYERRANSAGGRVRHIVNKPHG